MGYQLVIYDDPEVRDIAVGAVKVGRSAKPCDVRNAANLFEAEQLIQARGEQSCDLVVIGASTPPDAGSLRTQPSREPTREFIRKHKKVNPQLRIVVLAAVPDERLAGFLEAYDEVSLLQFDSEWRDALIREAIARPHNQFGNHGDYLELEITLDDSKSGRWTMRRQGRLSYEEEGLLPLDERMFDEIVEHSRALEGEMSMSTWKIIMSNLSQKLEGLLFDNVNRPFWRKFVEARSEAGEPGKPWKEKTWIRFGVSEQTQDAFVEAVKEDTDTEHWMLTVPMFRKYPPAGRRLPLFKDIASREGPINCLIIEADPNGGEVNFDGRKLTLRSLSKTDDEAEQIESILKDAAKDGDGLNIVRRVRISDAIAQGVDPLKFVIDAMRQEKWNLVHFAGHAVQNYMRDPDGHATKTSQAQAALVLSADQECLMPTKLLSQHLNGTQFLFLSCCRSAESSMIMRLTEKLVPAVLGYRWRVDDTGAFDFAKFFYTELFNRANAHHRYLEYAFRDARRQLYDQRPNDTTWASPMLVLQMKQAEMAY